MDGKISSWIKLNSTQFYLSTTHHGFNVPVLCAKNNAKLSLPMNIVSNELLLLMGNEASFTVVHE